MPIARPRSYAAIDLGTNNCRLLIARPQNGELVVIDAFSRIVRLGEGLHGSGNYKFNDNDYRPLGDPQAVNRGK